MFTRSKTFRNNFLRQMQSYFFWWFLSAVLQLLEIVMESTLKYSQILSGFPNFYRGKFLFPGENKLFHILTSDGIPK